MGKLIPLALVRDEEKATIAQIQAGYGLARRLAELGFVPGTIIRVLSSHFPGPIMVSIKGSRIALGRGIADKILVYLGDGRREGHRSRKIRRRHHGSR